MGLPRLFLYIVDTTNLKVVTYICLAMSYKANTEGQTLQCMDATGRNAVKKKTKLYLCLALPCVGGVVVIATPGHLAVLPLPALATLAVRVWCLHIAPHPTCVNIATTDLCGYSYSRLVSL